MPFSASALSTLVCVAMPAWSVPSTQRVGCPCMRARRMQASWMVSFRACPMCSMPVMFGGGMTTVYGAFAHAPNPGVRWK